MATWGADDVEAASVEGAMGTEDSVAMGVNEGVLRFTARVRLLQKKGEPNTGVSLHAQKGVLVQNTLSSSLNSTVVASPFAYVETPKWRDCERAVLEVLV